MRMPKVVTLANLSKCTAQQVVNHVCYRLAQQGFKQSMADGMCAYRTGDGLACAAGHCLSDADYAAYRGAMEGLSWDVLVDRRIVPTHHQALIADLQDAHDWAAGERYMPLRLRSVCAEHGLKAPACLSAQP